MDSPAAERPSCFGELDTVFPRGDHGLREVSAQCWGCPQRVECLRAAVAQPHSGQTLAQEQARREQDHIGGVAGFLRRWSRLKSQQTKKGRR